MGAYLSYVHSKLHAYAITYNTCTCFMLIALKEAVRTRACRPRSCQVIITLISGAYKVAIYSPHWLNSYLLHYRDYS